MYNLLMDKEVAVIVTAKNNENIIRPCLDSISNQTYKKITCFLADDGSTDKTLEITKSEFPQTIIVSNEKKGGPAMSRNLALAKTNAPYVLFMDSDATISPKWIEDAVKIMESNPNMGMLGGKIFDKNGKVTCTDSYLHVTGISGFMNKKDVDFSEYLWWPSCTLLARTSVVKLVGGFDDTYRYPVEDVDICWRINLAGYKVVYCSNLYSIHNLMTTAKKEMGKRKIMQMRKRNKIVTLLKNLELISILKYGWMIVGFIFAELLILPEKSQVIRGNFEGFLSLPHIVAKRREIRHYRKVTDRELGNKLSVKFADIFTYGVPNENI
jgi:GT2 family glycosyltransferase